MSENKKPFTELVTKRKAPADLTLWAWVLAGVFAVAAMVFVLLWLSAKQGLRDVTALQQKLDMANDALAAAQNVNQTNQDQIAALQSQIADLQNDKASAAQMANNLEDEMRKDMASKDVTISKLQGQLTVTILDRIMFDSGEAVLKPGGQEVMEKVAQLLAKHPDLKILVVGHTDNVPIRPSAHSRFASNWELSTARALAAVHCLVDKLGVDPRRVGAAGYGEFRPIADNSTPEGRAKNRRIEIAILPNDLTGMNTMTTNSPAAPVTPLPIVAPPTNAVDLTPPPGQPVGPPVLPPVTAPVAPPVKPPPGSADQPSDDGQ